MAVISRPRPSIVDVAGSGTTELACPFGLPGEIVPPLLMTSPPTVPFPTTVPC